MIKFTVNYNKQDIVISFSINQQFPKIEGKLISIEICGKELSLFLIKNNIPVNVVNYLTITWYGKHARRVLYTLNKLFNQ